MSSLSDASVQFDRVLVHIQDQIDVFFKQNKALTCSFYLGRGHRYTEKEHAQDEAACNLKYCDQHATSLSDALTRVLRARGYSVTSGNSINVRTKALYTILTIVAVERPGVPNGAKPQEEEDEEEDGIEVLRGD